ncbi:hypothetical protein NBRC116601_24640 [Cognatishimia sp. WU-CL00825]|uniref:hypothetical protein n=1 Tax=Cognatishimia sp. WU-CL00825 TaxID=3127658 RepID=UPI003103CE88
MPGTSDSVMNAETATNSFTHGFDQRLQFHEDLECMEADFSSFHFANADVVHRFYDRIEQRIAESGHSKWFFLVNYSRCHITPKAWPTFALRGKRLNLAHSQGSVRCDATPETRLEIESRAQSENFDANLLADRESALKRVAELTSARQETLAQARTPMNVADFDQRLRFEPDHLILELDHSDLRFRNAGDVDAYFGYVEQRIKQTRRRWFLLTCNTGFEVDQPAWIRWSFRLRRLLEGAALGAVQYGLSPEQREDLDRVSLQVRLHNTTCKTRAEAKKALTAVLDDL